MLDEFKKENFSTYYGEFNKSKEIEAWLLVMKKYFRVHDFSKNMKESIAIFTLKRKFDIWWEDLRNFKDVREKDISSRISKRYFQEKYLFERYYYNKVKEFHEEKLG